MDASECYRDPDSFVSQGDIFETVPHLFPKDRPKQIELKMATKRAGCLVDEFGLVDISGKPVLPECGAEIVVPAPARVGFSVLLSHSCEIDKDRDHRVIALVRQMGKNLKPEEKEIIRGNGRIAYFHLPALEGKLPESYIDFRRISTVGPHWLSTATRPTALSDAAMWKTLLAMFLFFSRLRLDPDNLNVIEDGVE